MIALVWLECLIVPWCLVLELPNLCLNDLAVCMVSYLLIVWMFWCGWISFVEVSGCCLQVKVLLFGFIALIDLMFGLFCWLDYCLLWVYVGFWFMRGLFAILVIACLLFCLICILWWGLVVFAVGWRFSDTAGVWILWLWFYFGLFELVVSAVACLYLGWYTLLLVVSLFFVGFRFVGCLVLFWICFTVFLWLIVLMVSIYFSFLFYIILINCGLVV